MKPSAAKSAGYSGSRWSRCASTTALAGGSAELKSRTPMKASRVKRRFANGEALGAPANVGGPSTSSWAKIASGHAPHAASAATVAGSARVLVVILVADGGFRQVPELDLNREVPAGYDLTRIDHGRKRER